MKVRDDRGRWGTRNYRGHNKVTKTNKQTEKVREGNIDIKLVPKRRLRKSIAHPVEASHELHPVRLAQGNLLKEAEQDVLMDIRIPFHSLTRTTHCV